MPKRAQYARFSGEIGVIDRLLRFFSRSGWARSAPEYRMTTTLLVLVRSGLITHVHIACTWYYWGIFGLESSQRVEAIRGSNERREKKADEVVATARCNMDYLSYLYTPQQMSGGASFGHSTRVGNWSEDYELQQHRIKDYIARKEAGTLTVSKMQQKLMHHLQPVQLTKANAGDSVQFGNTLLLWNHAAESFVATDLGDSEARDDGATHCAATATKYSYPCARNALQLSRVENDGFPADDPVLHYGQTVRFSTTEALGEPVYLHSYPHTPTVCSKYTRAQETTFGSVPEQYTLWKVMHVNPQARLETDGEPVPINTAVVLVHVCTNSLLAASKAPYANDFQIEHGDSEMCVKTYAAISKANYGTRSHEFEGAENHFVMVAEQASEKAPEQTSE